MTSPNPTSPPLPPQAPLPTGKPARRGLRVAIVVIVLLAVISAVASTAPSTISNASHAYYPKPVLGTITLSGSNGSNIPANQVIQFSVQVQAGRDLSYRWDFGDNTPAATAANPTHTYSQFAMDLTVSVTVTDPIGQTATATRPLLTVLPPPPTASFAIVDQSCFSGGCFVSVDGSGSQAGDPRVQLSYSWDWGDGQSDPVSSDPFAEHSYSQASTYTITLTVIDEFGQHVSTQRIVTLSVPVMATFSITNSSCDSNSQTCTVSVDASGSTGQGALTYSWNWGDGTSNVTATPQTQHAYVFQTGITYTITLTVTDSTGQTSTYQQTVSF
jgi:PKD repeat protein